MAAGLYIHIPFCKSRCLYCGFFSTTALDQREAYVERLCREMDLRQGYLAQAEGTDADHVGTIYLGGGTPSSLTDGQLRRLFAHIYKVYRVCPEAEVTIEVNPDDVTDSFANLLAELPVNRVSMGIQTFADCRLRFLGRRHTAATAQQAVARLRQAGIKNISIDLMFGFPGQQLVEWESDLQQAVALGVEHISAYSLAYEEHTPLANMLQRGEIKEVDEELSLAMYHALIDRLTAANYEHYEISNFARPGFRSQHNSSYWQQVPYIGIGAAAHSYNIISRQWNSNALFPPEKDFIGYGNCNGERDNYQRSVNSKESGNGVGCDNSVDSYCEESGNNGVCSGQNNSNNGICSDQNNSNNGICSGQNISNHGVCSEQQQGLTTSITYEPLDIPTRINDLITTALRTAEGISLQRFRTLYGQQALDQLLAAAQPHISSGNLTLTPTHLHLTRKGLFLSDMVMSDLMTV